MPENVKVNQRTMSAWARLPETAAARKEFEHQRNTSWLNFLHAARKSTDPDVRGAVREVECWDVMTKFSGGESLLVKFHGGN